MIFRRTVLGTSLVLVVSLYHPFPAFLHSCIPAFLHSCIPVLPAMSSRSELLPITSFCVCGHGAARVANSELSEPFTLERQSCCHSGGRANSIADGTYGDGIGRVDEMDRAGESGEVLCEPLYPGVIAGKISRRRDKGVIKAKKNGQPDIKVLSRKLGGWPLICCF